MDKIVALLVGLLATIVNAIKWIIITGIIVIGLWYLVAII